MKVAPIACLFFAVSSLSAASSVVEVCDDGDETCVAKQMPVQDGVSMLHYNMEVHKMKVDTSVKVDTSEPVDTLSELEEDVEYNATSSGRRRRRRRAFGACRRKFKRVARSAGNVVQSVVEDPLSVAGDLSGQVWDTIPDSMQNTVVSVGSSVVRFGNYVAVEATQVFNQVKSGLQDAVAATVNIGNQIASGIDSVLDEIGDFLNCLGGDPIGRMCEAQLNGLCECNSNTLVLGTSPVSVQLTCVAGANSPLAASFSYQNGASSSGSRQGPLSSRSSSSLAAPSSSLTTFDSYESCGDYQPTASFEANIEFVPEWSLYVDASGDMEITISGTVIVEATALISSDAGESECVMTKTYTFPDPPRTVTTCLGIFCITLGLHAKASMEVAGHIAGRVEMAAAAEWPVSGTITVSASGQVSTNFATSSITVDESLQIVASANAVISLDIGPEMFIIPMPGAPIFIYPSTRISMQAAGTFSETVSADDVTLLQGGKGNVSRLQPRLQRPNLSGLKGTACSNVSTCDHFAHNGTAALPGRGAANATIARVPASQAQTGSGTGGRRRRRTPATCGTASIAVSGQVDVSGIGVPSDFTLDIRTMIQQALASAAQAVVNMMLAATGVSCVPGVSGAISTAMSAATNVVDVILPDIPSVSFPSAMSLFDATFFCETLESFSTSGDEELCTLPTMC